MTHPLPRLFAQPHNALLVAGARTLEDVARLGRGFVESIDGMGPVNFLRVLTALHAAGIAWGPDPDPPPAISAPGPLTDWAVIERARAFNREPMTPWGDDY